MQFKDMCSNSSKTFILLIVSLLATGEIFAQCKTFSLSDRGDTLNCTDTKGRKQGKWLVQIPELRGTPGHEEEGEYVNGKKDGLWRSYTMQGDVYAVENYKWGLLNGKAQYYNLQGLEREESWWAIDPTKEYDTIEVPDLYQDAVYHTVIIKNEGRSMRHGRWKWFDPLTGYETKSEEYIRDSAINDLAFLGVGKSAGREKTDSSGKSKKVDKPSVVQAWEKKNSGKKKVAVRDGSAGY
jgi:hypothetical protein